MSRGLSGAHWMAETTTAQRRAREVVRRREAHGLRGAQEQPVASAHPPVVGARHQEASAAGRARAEHPVAEQRVTVATQSTVAVCRAEARPHADVVPHAWESRSVLACVPMPMRFVTGGA